MEEYRFGTDVSQVRITRPYHIQGQPQVIEPLKVYLRAHDNTRFSCGNSNMPFGPGILCGPTGTKTLRLRAMSQSKIERTLQVPEVRDLVTSPSNITERAGFEPAVGQALHSLSKAAP